MPLGLRSKRKQSTSLDQLDSRSNPATPALSVSPSFAHSSSPSLSPNLTDNELSRLSTDSARRPPRTSISSPRLGGSTGGMFKGKLSRKPTESESAQKPLPKAKKAEKGSMGLLLMRLRHSDDKRDADRDDADYEEEDDEDYASEDEEDTLQGETSSELKRKSESGNDGSSSTVPAAAPSTSLFARMKRRSKKGIEAEHREEEKEAKEEVQERGDEEENKQESEDERHGKANKEEAGAKSMAIPKIELEDFELSKPLPLSPLMLNFNHSDSSDLSKPRADQDTDQNTSTQGEESPPVEEENHVREGDQLKVEGRPRRSGSGSSHNSDKGYNSPTATAAPTIAGTSNSISSSLRLPLSRLRKKTVSRLFSSDNTTGDLEDLAPQKSSDQSNEHESSSQLASESSGDLTTDPQSTDGGEQLQSSATRPSLPRSLSSQSQRLLKFTSSPGIMTDSIEDSDIKNHKKTQSTASNASTKSTASLKNRPRSRTLNSLSEMSNPVSLGAAATAALSYSHTGGGFTSRPSFTSLLSSKLRNSSINTVSTAGSSTLADSDAATTLPGVASRKHSPSPRPSSAATREDWNLLDHMSPPPPLEDESDEAYLERIKSLGLGSATAAILSKSESEFHRRLLQRYVDTFEFENDPLDMALRKFLMYARLPRETQQIDRVLECFAKTYHNANPDIYSNAENAYIVVFSLMILHTDFFNKNNKHKMQKSDYLRNTYAKGVPKDVLECFYDNITYTPFIHTDEDFGPPGSRPTWSKRSSTFGRSTKDMVDPYTLLIDCRLDVIRPSLGAVLPLENPYSYFKVPDSAGFKQLRQEFIEGPYLQLVSQRSRPEAFLSPDTTADPEHSDPGVVDIKVVKIGILYRREARRMLYSKSTWKEWGAILTASQLYLFKDIAWLKSSVLSQQVDATDVSLNSLNELRHDLRTIKVPIDGFHPSSVLSTVDMIALTNSSSQEASNSFIIAGRGGVQDWFKAGSDEELTDWVTKINFAASFNTYHVGIQRLGNVHELNYYMSAQSSRQPSRVASANASDVEDNNSSDDVELPHLLDFSNGNNDSENGHSENESSGGDLTSEKPLALQTVLPLRLSRAEVKKLEDTHALRIQLVDQKLEELEEKCAEKEEQLKEHIRSAQHLKLLAPIQPRTREAIIFAAGRLAAKLDWHWLDHQKLQCYRDMFVMERDLEIELCEDCKNHVFEPSLNTQRSFSDASSFNEHVRITKPSDTAAAESINSGYSALLGGNSSNGESADQRPSPSFLSAVDSSSNQSLYYDADLAPSIQLPASAPTPPPSFPVPPLPVNEKTITNSSSGSTEKEDLLSPASPGTSPVIKKPFQSSLRDGKGLKVRKGDAKPKRNNSSSVHRSASLMRKQSGDFTLHGKKFSVVEVNPEFAATPNHQRTGSLNFSSSSSVGLQNPSLLEEARSISSANSDRRSSANSS
ncbi:hypothetical protein TRVA0_043S00980 [Trichomonascus vanleenenianus]|uniref:Arf family guanine nucleotide exchange factor SYT1 n=1 Tax=Trichomonascus vanleenenianus TaxID=2268995 RepID=UPI003ECAE0EE